MKHVLQIYCFLIYSPIISLDSILVSNSIKIRPDISAHTSQLLPSLTWLLVQTPLLRPVNMSRCCEVFTRENTWKSKVKLELQELKLCWSRNFQAPEGIGSTGRNPAGLVALWVTWTAQNKIPGIPSRSSPWRLSVWWLSARKLYGHVL